MTDTVGGAPRPNTCIVCGKEQTEGLAGDKATNDVIACRHCGNLVGFERNQFNAAFDEAKEALAELGIPFKKR